MEATTEQEHGGGGIDVRSNDSVGDRVMSYWEAGKKIFSSI